MARALTSDSFPLASGGGGPSKLRRRPSREAATLVVKAKQNRFSFSKPSEDAAGAEVSSKPNPFFFDFGKIPDVKSLVPVITSPSKSLFPARRKDPQTVFIAGATGQTGIRIAHALLRRGFTVRAGVPDLSAAQELALIAATYKVISPEESKRLNAVESAFEDSESIAKAIGPATKVVVTVGPEENGPKNAVTAIDALEVIRAAQLAGAGHVAIIYESNDGSSSTYNVLDGITSFFSNLFARSQPLTLGELLAKVVETDLSYTLIKASLTDDYSADSSYGLVLSKEGSSAAAGASNEFRVSKSQIAALVADVFSNTSVAENKVVEVSTSPSAPSKPIEDLFSAIPEDSRRKAYAEALEKAKAEEEARIASEKSRKTAEAAKKLEEEVKNLSEEGAQVASLAKEAAAGPTLDSLLSKAKGVGKDLSWQKFSSQLAKVAAYDNGNDKPNTQLATIRGQAKARNLPPQKAVVKQFSTPKSQVKTKPKEPEQKAEVKKIFGGLFKQETVYVDED